MASYTEKVEDIEDLLDSIYSICKELSTKAGGIATSTRKYKISDIGEGGGIVFYISPEGFDVHDGKGGVMRCHYLEMSKKNLGESEWGRYMELKNAGLGYGKHNTYEIVKANSTYSRTSVEKCAAYRCMQYKTATSKAGEWFLPNIEEAKLMIATQSERLNIESKDGYWWTSSSRSKDFSYPEKFRKDPNDSGDFHWYWHFVHIFNGYEVLNHDSEESYKKYSVRAIRAF